MSIAINPYANDSINQVYNLLFCDIPQLYRPKTGSPTEYPWNVLFAEKRNNDDLRNLLSDSNAESRTRILAANALMTAGQKPQSVELMGIVIEVALEEGLDVLAAFSDGSARYINHSEKLIVWEAPTETSSKLIRNLFSKSKAVVAQIGPWNKPRRPAPEQGAVRLTFLVSDGLYFGEGPIDVLFEDAMGGPVLGAATELMQFLTEANEN